MANISKPLKWQVNFGVTHELEYGEVIEFYKRIPRMQQGSIGRKVLLAGLQALKQQQDPVIMSILGMEQPKEQDIPKGQVPNMVPDTQSKPTQKINNKMLNLLEG